MNRIFLRIKNRFLPVKKHFTSLSNAIFQGSLWHDEHIFSVSFCHTSVEQLFSSPDADVDEKHRMFNDCVFVFPVVLGFPVVQSKVVGHRNL